MIKKNFLQLTFDRSFFAGGLFLYLGSMIVNVSNYLFHLILGRSLGPAGYGIVVSLISLLTVLSVPASAISTIATKFASDEQAKNNLGAVREFLKRLSQYLLIIGLLVFLALIVFAPYLANYLNINTSYVRIIAILILFVFLVALNRGLMQGLKLFRSFAVNTMIEPLAKIGIFLALFYLGLQITGAIWALIGSTIIAYALSFLPLKSIFKIAKKTITLRKIWHYSFYTFLVFVFLALVSYLDVLLVKHYFPQEQAGLYAALSTIGKIVLYVSMPIVTVMFPFISEAQAKGKKHFPLLVQTFLIVGGLSLLVLIIYKFAPSLVVGLLFGQEFLAITPYLLIMGAAYAFLALDYVFIYYYLSLKDTSFLWFLIICVAIFITMIIMFHQTIPQIIYSLITSFALLFILLAGKYIYTRRHRLKVAFRS